LQRTATCPPRAAAAALYAPGGEFDSQHRLVWVDRRGQAETILEPTRAYFGAVPSPDGRQLLVPVPQASDQIVSYDLSRNFFQSLRSLHASPQV